VTVLAAEAATEAGTTATAARSRTVPARPAVPRSGGRTQQGARAPARTGGRAQQGTQGGRSVRPAPVSRPAPQRSRRAAPRSASRPAGKHGYTSYQVVILGEFVAAILLVAATPFAKRDKPGLSPYAAADMLQLIAITLVYLILALISGANQGTARASAWFGGLILLTVGLGEAARLAKLLNVFGLAKPAVQAAAAQGGASPSQ